MTDEEVPVRRRRLVWQLYAGFLLVALVALAVVAWHATQLLHTFHLEQVREDLHARVLLFAPATLAHLRAGERASVNALCRDLGTASGTRFTVILPDGTVVGDSAEDAARMDNHAGRPEVAEALRDLPGGATRFSRTVRQEMLYVAMPLHDGARLVAVVRAARPLSRIEAPVRTLYGHLALGGLAIAAVAAVISWLVWRRFSRTLTTLRDGATRFAAGDLGGRIAVPATAELASLAEAINRMAEQLHERLQAVVHQRNEQDAVLTSMVEGVLAVDRGERVLSLNQAAARLLGTTPAAACGRTLAELWRDPALLEAVAAALASGSPFERELRLADPAGERIVEAHGTSLADASGQRLGVVIVLHDITRLRRLEELRREFVANVSHELKTPITAIKGYVETLLDAPPADPAEATRFLQIAGRHADRLNTIIEDLLLLSRLEQGAEELPADEVRLAGVLRTAVSACAAKAAERSRDVSVDCPAELAVRGNGQLLEQAVINLVDNALKYSQPGAPVSVRAARDGDSAVVTVTDRGSGIPAEHLPRLGERFYRVDKARSRQQGGTGLGLAIVKHIARVHGGRMAVTSTVGQGSAFSLHLPAA